MENLFHISELIAKKNKGTISSGEWKELLAWTDESKENLELYTRATSNQNLVNKLEVYQLFNSDKVKAAIEKQIFSTKTRKLYPVIVLKYAAILIPFLFVAGAFWYLQKESKPASLSSLDEVVKPGVQKATLILSDGNKKELDESNLLVDLAQGDASIENKENSLIYSVNNESNAYQPVVYNELITPRGGGYTLQLADGTMVTLNAGSSLKYPVAFTDSTRQVYLTGEAYFDVTHNGKPFIVSCDNMDIRVLGTSFNISSYPDDRDTRTTLVEGSVRITSASNAHASFEGRILSPEDQAIVSRDDNSVEIIKVNTSQYTSWVQGKLEFNHADLNEVMKRLARWYDFEYTFENSAAKNYHFTARINNDQSISSILEMLNMTTDVKFKINDNTVVIL